jgi:DNA-binding beta-propeller fold protein YncE
LVPNASAEISYLSCVEDLGSPAPCAVTQEGLAGATDLATSPDGMSVYAVSEFDDSIVTFDRNPSTGALTPKDCISDASLTPICGTTQEGLADAVGVAVSPDGKSVYAVSSLDHAIVRFDRDVATGVLSPAGCKISPVKTGVCGGGNDVVGLTYANDVVVSPDNKSVYVVGGSGFGDSDAIVTFSRDPGGALTDQGCFADSGSAICGPGKDQEGLYGARGVAISPDNKSVYVSGRFDDAIVRFDRDPVSGSLTKVGCISDPGSSAVCGTTQFGLDQAEDVLVTPDGKSVYVAGKDSDAVVHFSRDLAGVLTGQGCVADEGVAGCASTQQGLGGAWDLASSPDGNAVYVSSAGDHAIATLGRDPATGILSPQGFITTIGLSNPYGVATTADGKSLYAASQGNGAVFVYAIGPVGGAPGLPGTPGLPAPPAPSNQFSIKKPKVSTSTGSVEFVVYMATTGTLNVIILLHARPAHISARSKTLTVAKRTIRIRSAGATTFTLRPSKRAKKLLRRKGKLKTTVRMTFTPTGGAPKTRTKRLTLRLKRG